MQWNDKEREVGMKMKEQGKMLERKLEERNRRGIVDFCQRHGVCDKLVYHDLTAEIVLHYLWNIVTALPTTKYSSFPHMTGDQLKWTH